MSVSRVRGSSLIELALLSPLLAFLVFAVADLGTALTRQIQLERLSAALVRDLAAHPDPGAARASEWLAARNFMDIHAEVEVTSLPSSTRLFPRNNSSLQVVAVTLRRVHRGPIELRSHAREIVL